jgi:hypothetical protein
LLINQVHPKEIRAMAVRASRVMGQPVTGGEHQAA